MTVNKILDELYSIDSPKFKLGLKRMNELLRKLKNPEKNLKCIHVAGTNGKGSVCIMLQNILAKAGYNTGLYTSPHLKKFNERIRVNNNLITDKEIIKLYKQVKPHITNQSFFEITTAMAFLYFKQKNVDYVVLEVGLGGRLDSTNVITPLVSVITNIGKEHTKILGNTIEKIAKEKAAIIKKNIPVITSAQGTALSVIKNYAKSKNAPISIINNSNTAKKFNEKNSTWKFNFENYKNISLSKLRGSFQIINAITAIKATEVLIGKYQLNITDNNIKEGFKTAYWPARFEKKGNIIIDCAHNVHAFKRLMDELSYIKYNKLIMILGFSEDKNIKQISKLVGKEVSTIILTQATNPRAISAKKAAKHFSMPIQIKNPKKALQYARQITKKSDLIVVAGSIYMVGEL